MSQPLTTKAYGLNAATAAFSVNRLHRSTVNLALRGKTKHLSTSQIHKSNKLLHEPDKSYLEFSKLYNIVNQVVVNLSSQAAATIK